MKGFTLKAAIALEEASRIANRWAYNKSIKTLLQDWLTEGLQKKQDGARAVYEQFLSELNENLACLPSKSVRVYLNEVKRILCSKRRFHQGILTSHYPKEGLMAKCQQMNNGTTYQSLAWQQVYDILALEIATLPY